MLGPPRTPVGNPVPTKYFPKADPFNPAAGPKPPRPPRPTIKAILPIGLFATFLTALNAFLNILPKP